MIDVSAHKIDRVVLHCIWSIRLTLAKTAGHSAPRATNGSHLIFRDLHMSHCVLCELFRFQLFELPLDPTACAALNLFLTGASI